MEVRSDKFDLMLIYSLFLDDSKFFNFVQACNALSLICVPLYDTLGKFSRETY